MVPAANADTGAMPFDPYFSSEYRPPHRRHRGNPIRAFLELHPGLLRTLAMLVVVGALIVLTVDRLLLAH